MGIKVNENPGQINGQGRQTLRIELDPGTYDSFDIVAQATIQGGAEAVGLFDMIEDIRLYTAGGLEYFDLPFNSVTESSFTDVIHDLRPAIVNDETQLISNPDYVANELSFSTCKVFMPLIIGTEEDRTLEIVFSPIGADPTITGASGDLNVHFESGLPIQEFQVITPTVKNESNHRIMMDFSDATFVRVVMDGFANNSITAIKMKGADGEYDLYFDEAAHVLSAYHDYALMRQDALNMASGLTGVNLADVLIQPYKNRRLDLDLTVAQQPKIRFYAIATLLTSVAGTAGDRSRGNVEATKVDMTNKAEASTIATEGV